MICYQLLRLKTAFVKFSTVYFFITGCHTKYDLNVVFDFCCNLLHSLDNLILKVKFQDSNHKILLVLPFLKCGLPFLCFQYFPRYEEFRSDLKNFKILTKFLISPVIFTAQKRQTTFWKFQDQENFVVIVSRIIHGESSLKTECRKQIPRSSCLATVMFRGTPTLFLVHI